MRKSMGLLDLFHSQLQKRKKFGEAPPGMR
jgi:hypothetical protein